MAGLTIAIDAAPSMALWRNKWLHCFPQWMWDRHGPALHRTRLASEEDLRSNRTWSVDLLDMWLAPVPEPVSPESAVAITILEMGPRWLAWWGRLLTRGHGSPVYAIVPLASDKPQPRVSVYENARESTTARDRTVKFCLATSPEAQHLAQLLAALPGDVEVTRDVQRDYLPGTGPELLAELLAAKLLRYALRTASA